MKKIAILGASGSIGTNTLEVIRKNKDKFDLVSFSVYSKIEFIDKILSEFNNVNTVGVKSIDEIKDLIIKYPNVSFYEKEEGLNKVASSNCDVLVNALVGFVGLIPTITAIQNKKEIALANKETLVVAGELVNKLAKENNVKIVPIDSEHSAIFQCLEKDNEINKVIITASGGPFFKKTLDELKDVTKEEALNHPTWNMGQKITIDSATMFNKAFEVIEAHYLFDVDESQIDVLIHPQSIVHSMVEFKDGSIKAHLAVSDMKIPIAYALTYPNRLNNVANNLHLEDVYKLEFYKADLNRFYPLKLAYNALKEKGLYPCVLNAANEEAVSLFLHDKIKFYQIVKIVDETLKAFDNTNKEITIEKLLAADKWAREYVRRTYL
ncbi:MAG: 1-deoxy-D-xylulose-5-phosphate reductoisomerase [Bacilli bacterium]|nr:1-deoxy-D-xylulose-5-phosphate reductoisomerase [Bacilli bacterium]